MRIERYGETGIRLVFGYESSAKTSDRIRKFHLHLKSRHAPGIVDIIPCSTSCLVLYDNNRTAFEALAFLIREGAPELEKAPVKPPRIYEIPVRYGGEWGPDLKFVSSYCHLSEDEVVSIHTSTLYTVLTIGFLPGYPYLGPLDERLNIPRLETPRVRVPKGSVGIAHLQTGVYTFESPGGWRVIGRTEKTLFNYRKSPYSLLKIGDRVKFIPL